MRWGKDINNDPLYGPSPEILDFINKKRKNFKKAIVFGDILKYCMENSVEDSNGIVILEEEDNILVYNSYVENLNPIEFLYKFFEDSDEIKVETIDPSEFDTSEAYYIKGVECFKHEGSYWEVKTGKKIK